MRGAGRGAGLEPAPAGFTLVLGYQLPYPPYEASRIHTVFQVFAASAADSTYFVYPRSNIVPLLEVMFYGCKE